VSLSRRGNRADRIEEIHSATCEFVLDEPLSIGGRCIRTREYTVARVTTGGGLTGNAYAYSQHAPLNDVISEVLTEQFVGENWSDVYRLQETAAALESSFPKEIVRRAYSLIDICLWDLRGKALRLPLWRLLGGYRQTVPVLLVEGYPRLNEAPETFAQRIADRAQEGFTAVKIAYSGEPRDAADRLRETRARVSSEVRLVVDAAWAWKTVDEAVAAIAQWSGYDLSWVEDPFPATAVDLIAGLRAACASPIGVGDELTSLRTLIALLSADAIDVVRLDVTELGGLGHLQTALALASGYGRPVSPHIYPEVTQHLAFAQPGVSYVEMFPDDCPFWCTEQFVRSDLNERLESGSLTAPTQPGLGMEVDWNFVEAHRSVPAEPSPASSPPSRLQNRQG
jgi:L-alanine-DL-glutamate epimerase-like enolase superfamily enzyme